MTAHINLGSNIGDRRALLETAVARIEAALGVNCRRSAVIESEPWGYNSPNRFLNLGISIDAGEMTPFELHRLLQKIQSEISAEPHRTASGAYADRAIDIDLICMEQIVIDTAALTLPHPRMHLREFVLRPLAQLQPAWYHPLLGKTAAELLANL